MPPQKDPPKLTRSTSTRQYATSSESVAKNQQKIADEFSRNIKQLIETEDFDEKKQYQDQLLDSLKLTKQRTGDISKCFQELLQLGYAGLIDTLQVFAKAVNHAVTQPELSEDNSPDMYISNRKTLFENEQGRDILRRVIWCSSSDDSNVMTSATSALTSLCGNLQEFLQNIRFIPLTDPQLTGWVALEIFQRTISNEDESSQHVIYSFESSHPYQADSTMIEKISIPGASSLRITFDSQCRTGVDTLTFYRDEELVNELKIFS